MSDWNRADKIGFDFETSGSLPEYALQPWRRAQGGKFWATSLVWIEHNHHAVRGGVMPTAEMMAAMLRFSIDNDKTLVGWNTPFDISVLLAYGLHDLVMRCKWLDGMLLWKHATVTPEYDVTRYSKKHYGLKDLVSQLWPESAGYEDGIDFHSTDPELVEKRWRYNIKDVIFTLRGAEYWWNQLPYRQQRCALIEARCLPMVAEANFNGMPVDTLYTHDLSLLLEHNAAEAMAKLEPFGVKPSVLRSPTQLSRLLFTEWGLNPVKKSATGALSTDKETLHELSFLDERAKWIRTYRESVGNQAKFADTPLESAAYNGDGCVHPQAHIYSTYSGRMTYASKQGKNKDERPIGFAVHQEISDKRGKGYRNILIAPPDHDLLEFDAAGQEFRWMAVASGDPTMLELCQPGQDPHTFMGAQIAHMDYFELLVLVAGENESALMKRKLGKLANLCVAGGTTILTDRGPCSIEHVRRDDRVWDGEEFVTHDGVTCSGVKPVISHSGVTATPAHEVSVRQRWVCLDEAQRMEWPIDQACSTRNALRIMGGIARRTIREVGRAVCDGALRVWRQTGSEPSVYGDRPLYAMQGVCDTSTTSARWRTGRDIRSGSTTTETCQRMVSALQQSQRSIISQLRRTWDQVSVWFGAGGRGVHQTIFTSSDISSVGYRPQGQRRSLRAWKLAVGHTQAEPCQSPTAKVYDIVNCGPRSRFAANGRIVHNSLQYRTSAPRLRSVARVDYDIPMSLNEAAHDLLTYLNTYSMVPVYWDNQIVRVKQDGYVETYAGRRVQMTDDWNDRKLRWSLESTAINFPIQGTGADQKYLALMCLRDYCHAERIKFVLDMHDGLYFFSPKAITPLAIPHMKHILDTLPYKKAWGFEPPIPMFFDAKKGQSWGALKKWEPV